VGGRPRSAPGAAFVFNAYRHEPGRGRGGREGRTDVVGMPECLDGRAFLERVFVLNWGGCPVFGTTMVRRSCLDEVGLFDPRYSMHSDVEMWARLASRFDVAYVAEPLITIMPREPGHLLRDHYWWERTVDVRIKRLALGLVGAKPWLARLRFEPMVRLTFALQTLPLVRHRRWKDAAFGLRLVLTGGANVAPPY
jgi:hypothetical protein